MRRLLPLLLIALAGCSQDPSGPSPDTGTADLGGTDATAADATRPVDAARDAGDGAPEVGVDRDVASVPDMAAPDALPDEGPDATGTPDMADAFAGRPIGQCTADDDCPVGPNGQMCSRALPGGACLGCGSDTDCPDGTSCSMFGACVGDCTSDDDCAPGLECLGSGRCAALACVAGTCPVPLFGCSDSDRCERIDCADNAASCPAQTTCVDGICIEDRALDL